MSRVGYKTSRVRNVCNSFPILPETCAKTIGQNVKHSIKAPCLLQNDDPSTRLTSQSTHLTASRRVLKWGLDLSTVMTVIR